MEAPCGAAGLCKAPETGYLPMFPGMEAACLKIIST